MSLWEKIRELLVSTNLNGDYTERRLHLSERTRAGLSVRANDEVCRQAIATGEHIYIQVRESDNFVLCNDVGRPTYYSKVFMEKYPNRVAATMKWVKVSPHNPLLRVEMGEEGGWYYQGDMWE